MPSVDVRRDTESERGFVKVRGANRPIRRGDQPQRQLTSPARPGQVVGTFNHSIIWIIR